MSTWIRYPVARAVGQELRRVREAHGLRQDDVARAARKTGLSWTRTSIAALETGRRRLDVDELARLPELLGHLLPNSPDLDLVRDRIVIAATLDWTDITLGNHASRIDSGTRWKASLEQLRLNELVRKAWPDLTGDELRAAHVAAGAAAEQAFARRLGVTSLEVAIAARRLWSRGLSEERDRRLADESDASPASLRTARGHVSRKLHSELESLVREAKRRRGRVR